MKKRENQKKVYRLYDKASKAWFEVTPVEYAEIDRWRTNLRKREQYHHRCMCKRKDWWLCDGMCQDCEFHAAGDTLSLDAALDDESGNSLLDMLPITDYEMSAILEKQFARQILKELLVMLPEAAKIGELRELGLNDEAIAEQIGIKRTTFRSRIDKARKTLREKYGEDFKF